MGIDLRGWLSKFDDPRSQLYIPNWIRKLWISSGALTVAAAKYLHGSSLAELAAVIFAAPVFIGAWRRSEPRLPPLLPRPKTSGPDKVTALLQAVYAIMQPPQEARLRVTLFVPDPDTLSLLQLARYAPWSEKPTAVSGTRIRMGTGDVGYAFTAVRVIHVSDADEKGGMDATFRDLGIEGKEIQAHQDQERKSFYSIPIVDYQKRLRFGVISLDSCIACFFDQYRGNLDLVLRLLPELRESLEASGVEPMQLPSGVSEDEGGFRPLLESGKDTSD